MRPRVYVTTNTLCDVHGSLDEFCCELVQDQRYRCTRKVYRGKPGEWLANRAGADAITGKYDWWLYIDPDNTPTKNPLDLIEFDKPLLILPTPIKHPGGVKWNTFTEEGDNTQPTPVAWGGTGCFLAKVECLAKLELPLFPNWDYRNEGHTWVRYSPDWAFCKRWIAAGYQIWTHWGYKCHHFRDDIDLLHFVGDPTVNRSCSLPGLQSFLAAAGFGQSLSDPPGESFPNENLPDPAGVLGAA